MPALEKPQVDDGPLRQLCLTPFITPAVSIALDMGIFESLHERPTDVASLAATLELPQQAVEALTATLVAVDLLKHHAGKFHLTALSEAYLLKSSPFFWGGMFALAKEVRVDHAGLLEALKQPGIARVYGGVQLTEEWKDDRLSAERAINFTRAMHCHSFPAAIAFAEHYPVKKGERFLDVAGGSGCIPIALAQRYPAGVYVVADLPPVCSVAKEYVDSYGVGKSVSIHPFDMFRDQWPSGFDYVFMAGILHDWDLESREYLVQQSFRALNPGGKILIYELLLNEEQSGPLNAALMSLAVMYVVKGKQFRSSELQGLLQQQGFVDCATQSVYSGYSIIQGTRPRSVS